MSYSVIILYSIYNQNFTKSSHHIAPNHFEKNKNFQLLRGAHSPSDTPLCAHVGAVVPIIPPNEKNFYATGIFI